MASLNVSLDEFGPSVYYTDKFRNMVEDHLHILRDISKRNIKVITQKEWAQLYRYQGDFYGLFKSLGFKRQYHWVILRLNGYRSRFDLKEELYSFIYPDDNYVDKLAQFCKQK